MADTDRPASALKLHAEIWKSRTSSSADGSSPSKSAESSQVGQKGQRFEEWVEPPIPFDVLEMLAQENFCHRACCKRIAMDTIGLGFDIVPIEGAENPDEDEKKELEAFFKRPNKDARRFMDFALPVMMDYKRLANACFEIVREEYVEGETPEDDPERVEAEAEPAMKRRVSKAPEYLGKPAAMYRVPARSVRQRRDKRLWRQQEGMETAYFRPFDSDENTLKDEDDPNSGMLYQDDEGNVFHELIYLKDDDGSDDYYGVPDIIAGMTAVKCAMYVDWWNLTFFKRNMVPETVVEVRETGDVEIDDGEVADTKKLIEEYMRFEMMGEPHGVLYLEMPKGIDVKFNKISVDVKDASWRGWRLELQDMILTLHSMPPHRLGIVRGGKTTEGALTQVETYKTSVIGPPQELFESACKDIIDNGFGYTNWMLKLRPFDTTDKQAEATLAESQTNTGALTIDEVRHTFGSEPQAEDYLLTKIPMKVLDPLLQAYAQGNMPGEVLERIIETGRFPIFTLGAAAVPAGATGAAGVEMVTDYATGEQYPKGPEEDIRQQYEHVLVDEYGYAKDQIGSEVPVQFGSQVKGMADIVIYADNTKQQASVVVECKTPGSSGEQTNMEQVKSYANVLGAEYLVVYDGEKEAVMQKKGKEWVRAEGVPKSEQAGREMPVAAPEAAAGGRV